MDSHTPDSSAGSQPRSVLITGGAGFIGSHVAEAFLDTGARVTVLDNLVSGSRDNIPVAAEFVEDDIRSEAAHRLIAGGNFHVLVHHAAQMDVRRSTREPRFDADVNIHGTLNLLEAAVKGSVDRVIFASTGGAIYGEQDAFPAAEDHPTRPVSPYGVSKLAGERYLYYFHVEEGLNATCLRYANVYGERQNPHGEAGVVAIFMQRLLAGEPTVIYGDGGQTRDYVHVSNVAAANLAAAGADGFNVFNVGTGVETTVVELQSEVCRALGVEQEPTFEPGRPGEQRRSVVDPQRAIEVLGLDLPLNLEVGLKRTAEYFRARAR